MATSPLIIAVERQSKRIVQQFGGVSSMPFLFQGDTPDLTIYVTDPPANAINPVYNKADMTGFGMRVSIGSTPTGTASGPTPIALATLTYDSPTKSFTGPIALNTAGINSHIGTAASALAYFEIKLTYTGGYSTILQEQFQIKAVVDEVLSVVPTPTDSYMTKNESLDTFERRSGLVGQTKIYKSQNGIWGREIGVNNDGSPIDNIIAL